MCGQRLVLCTGCFAASVLFTLSQVQTVGRASADDKKPPAVDVKSREALLLAAKDAYEGMITRRQTDPSVPNDIEYLYRWSRRWLEAERNLSSAKESRQAASKAHVDRMQWLVSMQEDMVKNGLGSKYELACVKFFRIEAEQWLAEEKTR